MFSYDRKKVARLMGMDYVRLGVVGQTIGGILVATDGGGSRFLLEMGILLIILGTGVLVGGCVTYARYHGMSQWWGLAGVFNVIGVLVLVCARLIGGSEQLGRGFAVIHDPPYRRDVWRMDVRVKLHPDLGMNVSEPIALQLARGSSIGGAMQVLAGVLPGLTQLERSPRFLINGQAARRRDELSNGDELTIFCPVAESAAREAGEARAV